ACARTRFPARTRVPHAAVPGVRARIPALSRIPPRRRPRRCRLPARARALRVGRARARARRKRDRVRAARSRRRPARGRAGRVAGGLRAGLPLPGAPDRPRLPARRGARDADRAAARARPRRQGALPRDQSAERDAHRTPAAKHRCERPRLPGSAARRTRCACRRRTARRRQARARGAQAERGDPRYGSGRALGYAVRKRLRTRPIAQSSNAPGRHMFNAISVWESLTSRLRGIGQLVPPVILRLIMGWEFWESGTEKYTGDNWFTDIQDKFPFPFSKIPADISWAMATYFELGGAILLVAGLFTRFAAYSLLVLTFVATAAVHWPDMITMWGDLAKGYAIT